LDGTAPAVTGIAHHDEITTVYNLSITEIHTFYVGAKSALVHNSCPDFLVHPNGTAIPVPTGAIGPIVADNLKGTQFVGGGGGVKGLAGNGLESRVSGVRVMDATAQNPGGYYSYFNDLNQTVNPFTGETLAPSDPLWHIQW
jgi:hypothetical protein